MFNFNFEVYRVRQWWPRRFLIGTAVDSLSAFVIKNKGAHTTSMDSASGSWPHECPGPTCPGCCPPTCRAHRPAMGWETPSASTSAHVSASTLSSTTVVTPAGTRRRAKARNEWRGMGKAPPPAPGGGTA